VENREIEWTRERRDELFRGLCGLANARGGTLEIGRGGDGVVVGVDNAKKLLEELPGAIRLALGVVPSVELLTEGGREYIAVSVGASGAPVGFRGRYYLRSGRATLELSGGLLNSFMLRKTGKAWDGGANGVDVGAGGVDAGACGDVSYADGSVRGTDGGVNGADNAVKDAICSINTDVSDTDGGVNGVNGSVNGADGGVSGVNGGVNEADGCVNEFRKTILELMRVIPAISAQRIAAALGTTKRRVESNINTMKKAGLLHRVGSDKAGRWEVRSPPVR
jgi:predicted HTH transcriptional regulator